MKNRRTLQLNFWAPVERTFLLLQFGLLLAALVYLLYVVVRSVNGVISSPDSDGLSLDQLVDQINYVLMVRILLVFGALFIVNAFLGLLFLHRLTGPLVRIRAVLLQLADGKVPSGDMQLRNGDFPTDVRDAMNRLMDNLRK